MNFPLQFKLLIDSQTNESIAVELADRFCVDILDFKSKSVEALRLLKQMQSKRYGFDQIITPKLPTKVGDKEERKVASRSGGIIKIQAMPKTNRDNPL